jgi:predicted nucleic acid-binding protein
VEAGTDWVKSLNDNPEHTIYLARISGAEIIAALFRRVRTGDLSTADAAKVTARFKQDFRACYQIVEVTERVVDTTMDLAEKYGLRGYDSVQLAAAFELNLIRNSLSLSGITFVCADIALNQAAETAGLNTHNPNNH